MRVLAGVFVLCLWLVCGWFVRGRSVFRALVDSALVDSQGLTAWLYTGAVASVLESGLGLM